jgi:catecholate siderophore receptor
MSSAIFEISKTNARIPDPSNPGFNTLGGKQRVRGFAFDISGTITPRLMLTTAYAYLDGEVVSAGAGTPSGGGLANAPEHSASAWIDYSLSSALDVGFGVRYVAEQLAQTGGSKTVPSYRLFDAMIRRRLNDSLTIKLNLTNLTNELYFEQLHPWHVVPGPGFTAMLALDMTW